MKFLIYGLRLRGDAEVRYVGQTKDVEQRFAGHFGRAKGMPWQDALAMWLTDNEPEVEWFEIDRAETREEARQIERVAVSFALKFGHRLYNLHLVPADKRDHSRAPLTCWGTDPQAFRRKSA